MTLVKKSVVGKALCGIVIILTFVVTQVFASDVTNIDVSAVDAIEAQNDVLPLGELQPASNDEKVQAKYIDALVQGLEYAELGRMRGEVSVAIADRMSEDYAKAVIAMFEDVPVESLAVSKDKLEQVAYPPKQQVKWLYDGTKFRYESRLVGEENFPFGNSDVIFDGEYYADYSPYKKSARISDTRPGAVKWVWPRPFNTYFGWGEKRFSEILKSGSAIYEGTQTVGDVLCHKVHVIVPAADGRPVSRDIWISADYGYCVKRMSFTAKHADGSYSCQVNEVEEFTQFAEGLWFPTKGKTVYWSENANGEKQWRETTEWTASFTPVVDTSKFSLKFPSGTKVFLNVGEGSSYVVE